MLTGLLLTPLAAIARRAPRTPPLLSPALRRRPLVCLASDGADEVIAAMAEVVAEHRAAPLQLESLHERLQKLTQLARSFGVPIAEMNSAQLKEACAERGLLVGGRKDELRLRLAAAVAGGGDVPPAPGPAPPAAAATSSPVLREVLGQLGDLTPAAESMLGGVVDANRGRGPQTGIFCDGSAVPNPGPGGWGVVAVRDGDVLWEARGHAASTTNNRMEMSAIVYALDRLGAAEDATIYSDSNLCVRTLNEWAAGWERNGWKRGAKKEPVENEELVREAWALKQARPRVTLQWIKAHDGSTWNEYADALAGLWQR